MGGVQGVYSDFLLHRLDDPSKGGYHETPPVPLPEAYPLPEEWKTPALWGVADSSPYFHDGNAGTLEAAVNRHHGDAENVYNAYRKLSSREQAAIITFLKTLTAPSDAVPYVAPAPAPAPAKGRLAMAR
jgi:CxxC motif-containing protein (DUF1111 family)